jgi:hypothetical protein
MNSVSFTQPVTRGIPDSVRQKAFNYAEATALASADPRYALKGRDRVGLSRGQGQMNQAGIDAARSLSEGMSAANMQNLDLSNFSAGLSMDADSAREQSAQALGGLQSQNAYADQMAALQRQQTMNNMFSGILGGLLR